MSHPEIELRSAATVPAAELAALFTAAFAGYLVPVHDTPALYAQRLRVDSTDLYLSRVARLDGADVGLILLSPRGDACRVSGMGVVAGQRRGGVGRRLLDAAVELLTAHGYRRLVLEVIEANEGARRLYLDSGFEVRRRLVGWERPARPAPVQKKEPLPLVEVDARHVAAEVGREADDDLPWQLRAESLVAYTPPARAFRLGEAASVLLGDPRGETLLVQGLVVRRGERRRGLGRRLLRAVEERFPGRRWLLPARWPEGLADGFFRRLGFTDSPWRQLEMELPLEPTEPPTGPPRT